MTDHSQKRRLLDAARRQDLASFIRSCATTLAPGQPFLANWHIHAIAWHLEKVRLGHIRRLIINMPPRSLKSISASVAFPAFVLGHDPGRRIICVSYAADLAIKLMNDFRVILETPWYRSAFPHTRLGGKNSEGEVTTTRHGSRLATSIGGTLTGRGGDLLIIDDPLKPQDALSGTKRQAVNHYFANTLLSRLDDKQAGGIVIVMQRLHMDDLVGFLTQQSRDWMVLNLPAIAEADQRVRIGDNAWHHRRIGEELHPEREPLAVLEELRRTLGASVFCAQYQQAPVPDGGLMIKREWVRYYLTPPERTWRSRIIQSWDTAMKPGLDNDWSVCTTWQVVEGAYYLLDVERGRFDFPALRDRVRSLAAHWKPTEILVEDAGSGTGLLQELRGKGLPLIGIKPEGNKVARMSFATPMFESGNVYLPERAPWRAVFDAELFSFPGGRHDDQVDSVSQALQRRHERRYGMVDACRS